MTSLSPDKFSSLHGRLMAILSADTSVSAAKPGVSPSKSVPLVAGALSCSSLPHTKHPAGRLYSQEVCLQLSYTYCVILSSSPSVSSRSYPDADKVKSNCVCLPSPPPTTPSSCDRMMGSTARFCRRASARNIHCLWTSSIPSLSM